MVSRHRLLRRVSAVLASAALCTTMAGCGLGTSGGYVPAGAAAGPLTKYEGSLDGASISVGSKNFTENIILGKMAIILLRATGAEVQDLTNIPGSNAAREAQKNGQINAMWEYTGTGWINYLGHDKPIPDERKQYEAVRDEDLETNRLVWLPPAPMNNTYGFAVTQETAKRLGVSKLSDLAKVPAGERTFCIESEFAKRADGLDGMLKTYGVPKSSIKTDVYSTGAIYDATAKGECNFGEVFTTDGRIVSLNLKVLADDKKYFPIYNVALVLTEALVKDFPEIADVMAPVSKKLTDQELINMNAEVDVDGREPADVAMDWLVENGFVTEE